MSTAARQLEYDPVQQTAMLDDLTRDSLRVLVPITILLVWLWAEATMLADGNRIFSAIGSFSLVAASCYVCYRLQSTHPRLAAGIYLGALAATVTVSAVTQPGVATLYFFVPVVLVAAILADPRTTWGTVGICIALVLIISKASPSFLLGDLVSPLLLLLLTALAAWLSSRRLYTALDWALRMTAESQKNAADARERRAEVRSILKSLEEAYVRLERANQALIFAREAADKAYSFKAEFVANVSHELRTPLNLIVGFSEMVATAPESYGGVSLPSVYRGDVMAIYRSARHLSDLINDVLDLSQIEAGKLPIHREPVDLGTLIREAVDIVRGLAQAKGLKLELDLPGRFPPLHLDSTRIRQVLLNLLSNATRFTDRGWIRVRGQVEESQVQIAVEDSGRGIAQQKIDQAFEAFSQLGEDRARQGTGLGLALSRRFVELHGGMMWIDSVLGQGTTVGFTLPREEGSDLAPALVRTAVSAAADDRHPRVLLLHSDPYALSLLRRYVDGYRFMPIDSVDEAFRALREASPVAMLLGSDWRERWAEVAAQVPTHLPVLSCPLPSLRQAGRLLGAVDYIAKPIRRDDLSAALSRLPKPPRSVLIVDDDRRLVRLLARMLAAGHPELQVIEAFGGEEGLALVRSQCPDLLLLDLLMPDVSGYDVLVELGRDPTPNGPQVIIMSARAIQEDGAPIQGELTLQRAAGLSLTEIVQATQGMLDAVTQPAAVARANA